jgi:hypothetical protein
MSLPANAWLIGGLNGPMHMFTFRAGVKRHPTAKAGFYSESISQIPSMQFQMFWDGGLTPVRQYRLMN